MDYTYRIQLLASIYTLKSGRMVPQAFPIEKLHYLNLTPFREYLAELLDNYGLTLTRYDVKDNLITVLVRPTGVDLDSAGDTINWIDDIFGNQEDWLGTETFKIVDQDWLDYELISATVIYSDWAYSD